MSILQEYEEIRKDMGEKKFDSIEIYLKEHPNIFLSDILYKSKCYIGFDKWYNNKILNRNVKIIGMFDTDYDDIRCDAILYSNNKPVANIVGSYDKKEISFKCDNNSNLLKEVLRVSILDDFDKYTSLPKVSKCSKLLQIIYDNVCQSESLMCHITQDDWNEFYKDDFTEKDIENLKKEVKKLNLDDVLTFDTAEYKMIGWGDLQTKLNDDRYLIKKELGRAR